MRFIRLKQDDEESNWKVGLFIGLFLLVFLVFILFPFFDKNDISLGSNVRSASVSDAGDVVRVSLFKLY